MSAPASLVDRPALGPTLRGLWGELEAAVERAQKPEIKAWRDRYWPRHASLQGLGGGVCRISLAGDGTYQPDPDGELPAIILPSWRGQVPGRRNELFDLVAWVPTMGGLFTRRGLADLLGAAAIDRALPLAGTADPLVLFRDPGTWARAHTWDHRGDHGAVIVRWERVRAVLGPLVADTTFIVPDLVTGRRLRRALTEPAPPQPRILVQTVEAAA